MFEKFFGPQANLSLGLTLSLALVACALALLVRFLADMRGIEDTVLFRDPATEFRIPYYAGVFSSLGIASLFATAAITLITAIVSPGARLVAGLVCVFSVVLAFDDLLLLHERAFLGIPERVYYLAYAAFGVALFLTSLRTAKTYILSLMLAGVLLASSILLDQVTFPPRIDNNFTEDTLKFMGLAGWFAVWAQYCVACLKELSKQSP